MFTGRRASLVGTVLRCPCHGDTMFLHLLWAQRLAGRLGFMGDGNGGQGNGGKPES